MGDRSVRRYRSAPDPRALFPWLLALVLALGLADAALVRALFDDGEVALAALPTRAAPASAHPGTTAPTRPATAPKRPVAAPKEGLWTFRGNARRSLTGVGPVPRRSPRIVWRYPRTGGMCSASTDETGRSTWCGVGWTGQPNVIPRPRGKLELRFGAYDRRYHFLDASTGREVRPPLLTGDLAKGSATSDPDGFPLYYAGSRDNSLRVVALDRRRPTVLWKLDSYAGGPVTWNDDWDGAPLVVDGHLLVGGENVPLLRSTEMPELRVTAAYRPTGDQPKAIVQLAESLRAGNRGQTLLGATGTGKTATMAWVMEEIQRPALVIAHNKTLAAQLCNEFREFFPDNAVEYFVSYYDYYQPEAYVPQADLYIEKDSSQNDDIARLRLGATSSLLTRRDVVVVASVSCIYGLGSPEEWRERVLILEVGSEHDRDELLRTLIDSQYVRNDTVLARGRFRVRGDIVEVQPANAETAYRISMFGDEVEQISHFDPLTGEVLSKLDNLAIWPATEYVTSKPTVERAIDEIRHELEEQVARFESEGRMLEAHRIRQRTEYDMEMLKELGFTSGIENYSRVLEGRPPGSHPFTLIDYFPEDFVVFIDESHQTVPQIGGMYEGDRSRKQTLVDYGFRLPSALDNRPLRFDEFLGKVGQMVFVSATPGAYELRHSTGRRRAADPADRRRRPRGGAPRDEEPDRRPARRDPPPRAGERARPRHDADEEDVRGPDRLPARVWGQGALPPLRDRHARADPDHPRAAPRRVRRAGRRQPAPRRASTCRRCRSSRSSTRTRKASSAARRRSCRRSGARRGT